MEPESQLAEEPATAPRLAIPATNIVAIEHPSPVYNLEAGLQSFGPQPKFDKLLLPTIEPHALPLWFRPHNPAAKPITSHHAASNNILLRVTVPRRTGRKRRRGTDDEFQPATPAPPRRSHVGRVGSANRQDKPKSILRRLQDNAEEYRVEAVGMIHDSHRYRGLADFQFANADNPFLVNVAKHLLPLDPTKYRAFKLTPGMTSKPGDDIIPPPHFTDRTVPFFYQYEQNPLVRIEGTDADGEPLFVNVQGKNILTYSHFIPTDHFPVPDKPKRLETDTAPVKDNVLNAIRKAFDERPIWTRRALSNRLRGLVTENQMKVGIPLVGYQFRGGPWRDAVIRYGIDPRSDPKYRIYQTLQFKLVRNVVGQTKLPWQTIRKGQTKHYAPDNVLSHLWDGEGYSTDGKFWQLCDVTDPFLRRMLDGAPLRPECDLAESGWYYKAFWAKVKLFMKAKMVAIKHGRMGSDAADEPRRDNYIYNSYLAARLRNIPDDSDDKINPLLNPLLYPMSDLKGIAGKWRNSKLYPEDRGRTEKSTRRSAPGTAAAAGSVATAAAASATADDAEGDGGHDAGDDGAALLDDDDEVDFGGPAGDDGPDWEEEVASGGDDDDDEDDDDEDQDEDEDEDENDDREDDGIDDGASPSNRDDDDNVVEDDDDDPAEPDDGNEDEDPGSDDHAGDDSDTVMG
ncbi:RNA polymerase III transcription factor IIIC subunit-domain-containing protein [Microdochium trichocladiopsis]|uniref:RNA polymerase III transcription factor IIIC subunit-domain-containing protein n=1 Tax=Microdochium trichocladiopsis TaxID=1682393 RepID=A0A9P8Y9R8_9PEZI|nr:RNA polymerase III transcription factor IIIC subunit-domain-containing protein [Microdochium trichocladiopsis]KAH7033380.1 RNA polymerase III transcription factor IIIC subunit-domain-containing protein [Microdochium trichocladiopsis]